MSEAIVAGQEPEALTPDKAILIDAPINIKHADVFAITNSDKLNRTAKKQALLGLAVGSFIASLPSADRAYTQTQKYESTIEELITFADYLISQKKHDEAISVDLEMLDEAVSDYTKISPIIKAEQIRKLESLHSYLIEPVVLATKLWTFERQGDPDDMPSRFFETKAQHSKVVDTAIRTRGFGRHLFLA